MNSLRCTPTVARSGTSITYSLLGAWRDRGLAGGEVGCGRRGRRGLRLDCDRPMEQSHVVAVALGDVLQPVGLVHGDGIARHGADPVFGQLIDQRAVVKRIDDDPEHEGFAALARGVVHGGSGHPVVVRPGRIHCRRIVARTSWMSTLGTPGAGTFTPPHAVLVHHSWA